MRHRKRGRVLGRAPSHRKAMLKNLASALFLTERDAEDDENKPEIQGRIVTTVAKAKALRPLVEKCVTIACKALHHVDASREHGTDAPRNSDKWKEWRKSDRWHKWAAAIAPAVASRRRLQQLLGDNALKFLGLGGAKRLVNEFQIDTQIGRGTRVTVVRWKIGS